MRLVTAFFFSAILAVTLVASVPAANGQGQPQAAAGPAAATEIHAVLEKLVHPKKVKIGDPISARVTDNVKLKDGTDLAKGSHLLGKVTELKLKADKEGPSKLGVLFDKAQVKDGKEVPLSLALVSVGPPGNPGGVSTIAYDNKATGADRLKTINQDGFNKPDGTLSKGLGVRDNGNKTPQAMEPGTCYIENVKIATYSTGEPGTVLESSKSTVYLDSGSRLLFVTQ